MGMLPPGDEASFHWPWVDRKKLIQVSSSTVENVNVLPSSARIVLTLFSHMQVRITSMDPTDGSWHWSGDFPIDSIGEIHVKLRQTGDTPHKNRIEILKVMVELVQATVVVTFNVQDPDWPPYRVDNLTSYNIR